MIGHRLSLFGETLSTVSWPPSCQSHGDLFVRISYRPINIIITQVINEWGFHRAAQSKARNLARKANANVKFFDTLTWTFWKAAFTLESRYFTNSVWEQRRDWASHTKQDYLCSHQSFWLNATTRKMDIALWMWMPAVKATMTRYWHAQLLLRVCAADPELSELSLRGASDALGRNMNWEHTVLFRRPLVSY